MSNTIQSELSFKRTYSSYQKESRLIKFMYEAVINCIRSSIYWELLKKRTCQNHNWFVHIVNCFYDKSIENWCKVFGSRDGEPIHYHKLIGHGTLTDILEITPPNKETLKALLLGRCKNITEEDFDTYQERTKAYRNTVAMHREHDPQAVKNSWMRRDMITITNNPLSENEMSAIKEGKEVFIVSDGKIWKIFYNRKSGNVGIIPLTNRHKKNIDFLAEQDESQHLLFKKFKLFYGLIYDLVEKNDGELSSNFPIIAPIAIQTSLALYTILENLISRFPACDRGYLIEHYGIEGSELLERIEMEMPKYYIYSS